MKEHDIDNFFKDRLEKAGKTPSEDAWARLQSQMQPQEEKKKTGMWLMYIAASITAILLTVGAFYLGKQEAISHRTALEKPVKKDVKSEPAQTEQPVKTESAIAMQEPETPEVKQENHMEPENQKLQKTEKTVTVPAYAVNPPQNKPSKEKENADKPAKEKPVKKPAKPTHYQTFPDNAGEIMSAQVKAVASNELPDKTNILRGTPIEVIIQKSADPQKAPALLATTGNAQPENEDEAGGKLNLVKNIVKQAISLKNGDGVNLEELGIDPNNKIAFETQHAKEKISKLINL